MADGLAGILGLPDGQSRTRALHKFINEDVARYVPPNLRKPLGLLAEMNPVNDIYQAGGDFRDGDYVGAATNTATALVPVAGAAAAKPLAKSIAQGTDDATRAIVDALTMYQTGGQKAAGEFLADESGAVPLRGGGMSDPTQTGWTFRDVDGNLPLSKAENKRLSEGAKFPRESVLPIRSLYAMQDRVNPDFATTETSSGMLPNVIRKNGKLYLQDGHHRATKVAEDGGQNVRVNLYDFDNVDDSTPLLDYNPQKAAREKEETDKLLAELGIELEGYLQQ